MNGSRPAGQGRRRGVNRATSGRPSPLHCALILQSGQLPRTTDRSSAGFVFVQGLPNHPRAGILPPIAQWYSEDQLAYEQLFTYVRSANQAEGIELLHRIRQGQGISGILRLARDVNLLIQGASDQNLTVI